MDILGKGAKAGDSSDLLSSFNGSEYSKLIENTLTQSIITDGQFDFQIDDTVISKEGTYLFKAQLNDTDNNTSGLTSDASVSVPLDFTGPTIPGVILATNNSGSTDTGTSLSDNINKITQPVINLLSEAGLENNNIMIDISDGAGTSKYNKGSLSDLLIIAASTPGTESGTAIYPITFNSELADNNYGFSIDSFRKQIFRSFEGYI